MRIYLRNMLYYLEEQLKSVVDSPCLWLIEAETEALVQYRFKAAEQRRTIVRDASLLSSTGQEAQ